MTQNLPWSRTSGSDVIIFLDTFFEQLSELKKCNIHYFSIILAPPFECDSNYLTKNYTLRKVEFQGETLSTPIHSTFTGKRPRMDRDVSSETGIHQGALSQSFFSSYWTFSGSIMTSHEEGPPLLSRICTKCKTCKFTFEWICNDLDECNHIYKSNTSLLLFVFVNMTQIQHKFTLIRFCYYDTICCKFLYLLFVVNTI